MAVAANETEQTSGAKKKKFGGKALLAIIGLVLVANIGLMGMVFLGRGGSAKAGPKEHKKEKEEVGEKLPLEEFTVNVAGTNDHYLRATIALGLKKDVPAKKMEEEIPPIRDAILAVLSSKPMDELAADPGKTKLKDEIKEHVNRALGEEHIVKVYFTNFATQ